MRTLSADTNTVNNQTSNNPIVELSIAGITNRYCSGTFSDITGNHRKILKDFTYTWPRINLFSHIQPNTHARFTITDESNEFSQDITGRGADISLKSAAVTSQYGFNDPSIILSEFFTLPITEINGKVDLVDGFKAWAITAIGVLSFLEKDLFRSIQKSNLNGADYLRGSTATIPLASTSGWIDPTALPSKLNAIAYVQIDQEIIGYTSLSAGDPAATITRGLFGTQDTDHFDGAEVRQFFAFTDILPTDFLLYLLLTTSDGSGHAYYDLASFDSGFNDMGFGLSSSEVDIEGIERLGYKWFNEEESCHFIGSAKTEDARSWIVKNILKPSDLFLYINSSNQITIGIIDLYEVVDNGEGATSITQAESKIKSFSVDYDSVISKQQINFEVNPLTGQHESTAEIDNQAVSATPISDTFHEKLNPLLDTGLTNPQVAWNSARRLFSFFQEPIINCDINVEPPNWRNETYDIISLENNAMPDLNNTAPWGGLAFSALSLVVGQTIRPITNPRIFDYSLIIPHHAGADSPVLNSDFTVITEGSITDTTITFRSPADNAQNAAEGNHNFGSDINASLIMWDIRITPPNTGSTEHWISLRFKLFSSAPAHIGTEVNKVKILRYNSGDSTAFTVRIATIAEDLSYTANLVTIRSAYVQWYDASHGSTERPSSVELVRIAYLIHTVGGGYSDA